MATSTARSSARGSARSTARKTSRTATTTARQTRTQARTQSRSASRSAQQHGRRITAAARKEARAVSRQPARPAYFAVGVADTVVHGVKTFPNQVIAAPRHGRNLVVAVSKRAGDATESAQSRYDHVAARGKRVVSRIRRLSSTQKAEKYATRASHRVELAARDAETAVVAGTQAAGESFGKLG